MIWGVTGNSLPSSYCPLSLSLSLSLSVSLLRYLSHSFTYAACSSFTDLAWAIEKDNKLVDKIGTVFIR